MRPKILKYVELTKPKVTLLNLLVGVACFILAALPTVDWLKLVAFGFMGYLVAGGCGVLNSVYDQDIDKLMERTSKRAIPAGHIKSGSALAFGIAMIAVSFAMSLLLFNALTALMIGLGIVFYVAVYTVWLKRNSPWNVIIGGLAGCFAALAGWTAAANAVSQLPLLVATLDFLWTPGHLWGLAIKKVREYKFAKIPMLPVTAGIKKSSVIVFWLNFATIAFSFSLPLMGVAGSIYTVVAGLAGTGFLLQSRGLLKQPSEACGFRAFAASMPYLACLMLGLVLDKIMLI
jgi:heme o synthase